MASFIGLDDLQFLDLLQLVYFHNLLLNDIITKL